MKDGKVVEQGTHNELIAQGGEYYALYNVQTRAFLSVSLEPVGHQTFPLLNVYYLQN